MQHCNHISNGDLNHKDDMNRHSVLLTFQNGPSYRDFQKRRRHSHSPTSQIICPDNWGRANKVSPIYTQSKMVERDEGKGEILVNGDFKTSSLRF